MIQIYRASSWFTSMQIIYALSQPLPTGKFRFLDDTQNFDVNAVDCDGTKGYFLEVDLEYPDHLHDAHNE